MPKKIKLDDYHAHEALDRTHCVMVMIDELLDSHPWIVAHPTVRRAIDDASAHLAKAYQMIGNLRDKEVGSDE